MKYPTTFAETAIPLRELDLNDSGLEALDSLAEKGFEMFAGMQSSDVPEVGSIARQHSVREYCPKDDTNRFGSRQMAEDWHAKERGPFLLRQLSTNILAAYSWTGPEECDELPDSLVTFAARVSEDFSGSRLAVPVTAATLSGSAALYGAERVGLETWASNTRAVRTYLRAGAVLVTTRDDTRPTLAPQKSESDGKRRDVRLFMQFPNTFQSQSAPTSTSHQLIGEAK